ncbi:hypothetical protein [Intestinibacter bartlettii]|uniref:hypothetical protein n=1 Tax=Intestinibacter bartlettii TaxID=261299 RepID=UPI00351FF91F
MQGNRKKYTERQEATFTIKHKSQKRVMSCIDGAILADIPFNLTYKDNMYILTVTCDSIELDNAILGDCTEYFGKTKEPDTFYYIADDPGMLEQLCRDSCEDYDSHCSIFEGGFDEPTEDEWDRFL